MFQEQGYELLPAVFAAHALTGCAHELTQVAELPRAGTRNLLALPWCRQLADALLAHPDIRNRLPPQAVAVQCTYFEKTAGRNWLVAPHQDLSVPVAERIAHPAWRNWHEKEGGLFVQPPARVLAEMVAVRIHLDPCGPEDGALKVWPATHRGGMLDAADAARLRQSQAPVLCVAAAGDALLMRPLLVHSSSKATGTSRRRVLHFLFAPPDLPHGARWPGSAHFKAH